MSPKLLYRCEGTNVWTRYYGLLLAARASPLLSPENLYISGRSRRVTPPLFSFRPLDTHKRFFADPRRPIDHVDS